MSNLAMGVLIGVLLIGLLVTLLVLGRDNQHNRWDDHEWWDL